MMIICFLLLQYWYHSKRSTSLNETLSLVKFQGRSQNLKEAPQNFTEAFNVDDIIANGVIQRNQHRKEKKT